MSQNKEPKERLTGEERRVRMIDAALNLFAEKEFSGARTKEIARLAGISETLIFQHFKTKEDIYHSALQHFFSSYMMFIPQFKGKMVKEDDWGVFSNFATSVIKANREDDRIMRLALYNALEAGHFHEDSDYIANVIEEPPIRELLRNYIQQRIDKGQFRKVNAELTARLFMESVYMYVIDKDVSMSGPPLEYSDEEAIDTLVGIFLNGIRNTQE